MFRVPLSALSFASLLVGACSSTPGTYEELPEELRESNIVSVHEASARIPDTATFSWMPGSMLRLDPASDPAETQRAILEILEEALQRRGIVLVPGGRGELWVGYAIAVESALEDGALDQRYGIQRGEGKDGARHDRGALILDVVDRGSGQPLWRGSVAVQTAPSLPYDLKRERIARAIERLLDKFKQGY